jgi:hypothetical protein
MRLSLEQTNENMKTQNEIAQNVKGMGGIVKAVAVGACIGMPLVVAATVAASAAQTGYNAWLVAKGCWWCLDKFGRFSDPMHYINKELKRAKRLQPNENH